MTNRKPLTANQKLALSFLGVGLMCFILGFFIRNTIPVAQVNGEFVGRGEFLKKLAQTNGQTVLDSLVAERLIAQALKESKITVTDKEINDKILRMKKDLAIQKSSFEALLASTHQTQGQFKQELKIQLGVEKLLKSTVKVTDKEINDYFVTNKIVRGTGAVLRSQLLSIRDTIYRSKLRAAFLQWYQLQKGKAKVNFFLGL